MTEIELLKLLASIGGAGSVMAMVMFFIYRQDKCATEARLIELVKQDQENNLERAKRDQELDIKHIESHDANTRALTELSTLIRLLNGRLSK